MRGVVSNGMLCSAAELETAEESDGILELADLPIGTPAAQALALEAVIDFEVTPNRPDWLGVAGIARDLAAAGVGVLKDLSIAPVPGAFPQPIEIRLPAPEACPAFAGRLIRGLKNGPSPAWLQQKLKAVGLRPINALVDVTNLITYDRARPLHVYDAALIAGGFVEARLGREGERVAALDGKTYAVTPDMCVIADGSGAIGLGGVMGGSSTGCSEATTEVFIESAWFDPIRTAQTGRDTGIASDAQYRFARGVDPESLVPGIELATRLILDLCGGEASAVHLAGRPAGAAAAHRFRSGLCAPSVGAGRRQRPVLGDPRRPRLRPRRRPDPASLLAPGRGGQGRSGGGGGPHRRLWRLAGRAFAGDGAADRRRAHAQARPHPRRPPGPGGRRLSGSAHLVVHGQGDG